jgi:threonine/homoserine/homoserine lactone efflux protein
MLLTFLPVAALLTIAPGPATALVVRSAMVGGRRRALVTTAANELGVVVWALLSILGISALVAASEVAYAGLKVVGAGVLVWIGVSALLRARKGEEPAAPPEPDAARGHRTAFRDGLVTALANPKLAVFYVALFPQFIPAGAPILPATLLMTATIVVLDFVWYGVLAAAVARAKRAYDGSRLARRVEAVTGAILVGLGVRVALEPR